MFIGIYPMISGRPKTANAYCRWTGIDSGGSYDLIVTIRLRRSDVDHAWVGYSSNDDRNLQLEVFDRDLLTAVDVRLTLRTFTTPTNYHEWSEVPTTTRPPWGTPLLTHDDVGGLYQLETRILA